MFVIACTIVLLLNGALGTVEEKLDYDDALARDLLLRAAGAAYAEHPLDCLPEANEEATKIIKVENCSKEHMPATTCHAYVTVIESRKAVIIAFRGAESPQQKAFVMATSMLEDQKELKPKGKVSAFYAMAFEKLWDGGLARAWKATERNGYTVYVTGYGMGGALASIAAQQIVARGNSRARPLILYTFGQPLTGNKEFAENHEKQVFYPNDMSRAEYVLCQSFDDKECSGAPGSPKGVFFGKKFPEWGINSCKDPPESDCTGSACIPEKHEL